MSVDIPDYALIDYGVMATSWTATFVSLARLRFLNVEIVVFNKIKFGRKEARSWLMHSI